MAAGRKTGGRRAGTPNNRTKQREIVVREAVSRLDEQIVEVFQGDAHALLMLVYKDPSHPIDVRIDAAKAAIRFEKPALGSTQAQLSGPDGAPMMTSLLVSFVEPDAT